MNNFLKLAGRCRNLRPAAAVTLFAILFITAAPRANANAYNFSFHASNVLDALSVWDHDNDNFPNRVYFAIFLQPDTATTLALGTYGYTGATSPIPTGVDRWLATTVTDPSSPSHLPAGGWVQYSKLAQQSSVTVLGDLDVTPPGFIGLEYSDTGLWPFSFGQNGHPGTIIGLMSGGAQFSFVLGTGATLNSPKKFIGYASAIDNAEFKTFEKVYFEMTLTPIDVTAPEPGTLFLLFAGAACFGTREVRKRILHSRKAGVAAKG